MKKGMLEERKPLPLLTRHAEGTTGDDGHQGAGVRSSPAATLEELVPADHCYRRLKRTLLVLCGAGVSGWRLGMGHTATGAPHKGCNYPVRLTGRVAAPPRRAPPKVLQVPMRHAMKITVDLVTMD